MSITEIINSYEAVGGLEWSFSPLEKQRRVLEDSGEAAVLFEGVLENKNLMFPGHIKEKKIIFWICVFLLSWLLRERMPVESEYL